MRTPQIRSSGRTRIGLLVLALLGTLALAGSAQAQAPVGLGTNDAFAVLAGTTVTNTGPTVVNGDLGVSPGSACTGFPSPCTGGGPGTVNGTIHVADAVALQAQSDLTAAYDDAAGRFCNTTLISPGDLSGMTLTSGVYCASSSQGLTGTLTLDAQGDPNAVFIFQIGSTLTTAPGSSVSLINGAQACNVFWQVGSSATIDTTTAFVGNVLALTTIEAHTGATVDGRLLARNGEVTLESNTVTRAQCAVAPEPEPEPPPGPGAGQPPPDDQPPNVGIGPAPGDGITGNPVGGGNKPCVETDFRLRIKASDESGIRRVKVFLDGKLIKSTTTGKFFVWIRAEDLPAGSHTIRVEATDEAGNTTVKTRKFKRCERPVFPDFTG